MKAYLGDYVVTKSHEHRGRVTGIDHIFGETGESEAWFQGQQPPRDESTKEEKWYSILCANDNGSVVVPESDLLKLEEPYALNNIWEVDYFRDAK